MSNGENSLVLACVQFVASYIYKLDQMASTDGMLQVVRVSAVSVVLSIDRIV